MLRALPAALLSLFALLDSARVLASTPPHAFSSLDYGRRTDSGSIVFVPFLWSDTSYQEGITFYRSYFNDVQTPISWGQAVKSVEVLVTPTAHQGDAAEYNAFFSNTTRVDAQESWFASSVPCTLSSELDVFTSGFPPDLQPTVQAAGYPQACYVKLYYRVVQEAQLLTLLRANRGIVIGDDLPFCTATSAIFDTKPLVAALKSAGALAIDSHGNITGSPMKVLYALFVIESERPELLGGAGAADYGAAAFNRDALEFAEPRLVTLVPGYEDTRMTACVPRKLHIGQ